MVDFIAVHLDSKEFDAITAVPLDPDKKMERGFNQSELLSKPLAKQLGLPDLSKDLTRVASSRPQFVLKKTDRERNVRGCFSVKNPSLFFSKRVLLIDDILTTGQTVSECARVLKDAGTQSVTVLALARGLSG